MCGIAGVISYSSGNILPEKKQAKFVDPLKFRGPDDSGQFFFHSDKVDVSLFHTRLSIIDLNQTGHQPMSSENEKHCIVFNGEIYNYQYLRQELSNRGVSFRSSSDTEVLLQGYIFWGIEGLLDRIDGMFAFALFDKENNALFLAKDRFGKKPLYYSLIQNSIVFSSDIRSFYQIPSLHLTIDLHSVGYFFYEQTTPVANSIWKEVKKIGASQYAKFSEKGFTLHSYWQLLFSASNKLSWGDCIYQAETLLKEAVKKRLVADVPVAFQLSGGIDSSLVVAMMAQLNSAIRTYTVTFDDAELDERKYAQLVAQTFDTDHTEIKLTSMDVSIIDSIINEFGEPFADASMLPTYLICKEISKSEKVVCGGDGGDELFGGYHINYFVEKLKRVRKLRRLQFFSQLISSSFPSYKTNLLSDLLVASNKPAHFLLNRNISFNEKEIIELGLPSESRGALEKEHSAIWNKYSLPELSISKNVLSSFLHTRLENDYLVKVDRSSMFASLEMRSPFLDKDLASFAASLRDSDLFDQHGPKSILKGIARKYFPKDFVHRHKMGFGVPIVRWFREDLHSKFKEVVLGGRQSLIPMNYDFIERLLARHKKGENHAEKLWTLYSFHVWTNNIYKK
jgi:asparagine synthase (glutamine-hydrolysing)